MLTLDKKILEAANKLETACAEISDFLTDNPELGGGEKLAVAKISAFLEAQGYVVTAPFKGVDYSFLAVPKRRVNDTGPKAVLMCEYDALPEVGHACGHSLSCGASLLGALAVNMAYPDLPIRIDLMGTPGEEFPGGKVFLKRAGAFDDYEFAAMVHMNYENNPSMNALACGDRLVTFTGKNAHASGEAWMGRNALNAARIYMDALDMWRQHIPPLSQIHGIVKNGGELPSIVPDKASVFYYFRAKNMKELNELVEKAENCAKGAALCTDTTVESIPQYEVYSDFYEPDVNRNLVTGIMDAMGLPWVYHPEPSGSTDVGDVSYVTPTFHPMIDATGGEVLQLHSPEFTRILKEECAHAGIKNAGILLASLSHKLATDPALLKEVKQAHAAYNATRG